VSAHDTLFESHRYARIQKDVLTPTGGYSKGLRKYFNSHKVIKAVYSLDNILFYVKDDKEILRKYYFRIGSFNVNGLGNICYGVSQRRDMDSKFYQAFFIHEPNLPFTVGGS